MVAYGSRSLSKPERRYCVTRRELLAVVTFVKHFRPYLLGRRFILRTDHGSWTWLCNFREPEGQLAHWLEMLQEFDFEIVHRKGRLHNNADALSRIPCKQCGRLEGSNIEDFVVVQATTLGEDKEEELLKQQRDDPSLGPIIKAKQSGTKPSQQEQKKGSFAMRRLYQLWDQLFIMPPYYPLLTPSLCPLLFTTDPFIMSPVLSTTDPFIPPLLSTTDSR